MEEDTDWKAAEHSLHLAYVRLREIIPGAFDTPYEPSPETVWQVTEDAAKRLVARALSAEAALRPYCENFWGEKLAGPAFAHFRTFPEAKDD